MKFHGNVIAYGDNVDTDVIIPARYLNTIDKKELASHCMEDLDRDFQEKVKTRQIIVAGNNFGCGSSREHAPLAIKESGVQMVIAKSFARIFYRNSINIGMPVIVCKELYDAVENGDDIELDLLAGTIQAGDKTFACTKLPEKMQEILNQGGLIASLNKEEA